MAGTVKSCATMQLVPVVLVILCATSNISAYAVEREATVQLLPNDLIDADPPPTKPDTAEANRTVSAPQQVIRNQIVKIVEIIHQALEDTRRSIKQKEKRDLATGNNLQYFLPLVTCFVKLVRSGMLPESFLKGLLPPGGGSHGNLLGNSKQPLDYLIGPGKQDPVSNALTEVRMGGAVADLTGGRFSTLHSARPNSVTPLRSGVDSLVPGTGTIGGTAAGLATGVALGAAMAEVGGLDREVVPETLGATGTPAGGLVESAPLTATGAVGQGPTIVDGYLDTRTADTVAGFNAGYAAGMAAGGVARMAGASPAGLSVAAAQNVLL